MNGNKKCAQCGQEKPIEDFSKFNTEMCIACEVSEHLKRKVNKAFGCSEDMPKMPFLYCGRGIEVPIPDDATFISPMRFQASVAAMQGLLAGGYRHHYADLAVCAVACADALINELKKKKDENNQ